MKLIDLFEILREAPIGDIEFHGPREPASMQAADIGTVTSEKGQAKIRRIFEKTPYWIDLIVVNHDLTYSQNYDSPLAQVPDAQKYINRIITAAGLEQNPYVLNKRFLKSYLGSTYQSLRNKIVGSPPREPRDQWIGYNDQGIAMSSGLEDPMTKQYPANHPGALHRPTRSEHKQVTPAQRKRYEAAKLKYEKKAKDFEEAFFFWRENYSKYPGLFRALTQENPQENKSPLSTKVFGILSPEEVYRAYGIQVNPKPDRITLIIGFNEGTHRYPLTGWMIAHRLGHALQEAFPGAGNAIQSAGGSLALTLQSLRRMGREKIDEIPGLSTRIENGQLEQAGTSDILHRIGTFKAARDGNIGSFGEFIIDCFAQYLIQGSIRLNPLTQELFKSRMFRRSREFSDEPNRDGLDVIVPNPDNYNDLLKKWTEEFIEMIKEDLEKSTGKIIGF